ncbi:DUF4230 domain-containing protein [Bacillus salacetis]|uniref:DUF4230 domain-containing protein n=1 Tax=Bacillus salacetis TaxID=2315464 RepID=A0A3A1QVH9_9BACI|nr:DUF4230 domain-containing protein [Bacillus salacetis]RIW29123.1 DUF4230 domain-containing protein [Bacillus salacetis]
MVNGLKSNEARIREIESLLAEIRDSSQQASATAVLDRGKIRMPFFKAGKALFSVWKSKFLILLFIVILVISGLSIGIYSWLSGSTFQQEQGSFVEQIKDMNSLATAQSFTKAVIEQEDNKVFGKEISADIPGTKRKLLLVVPGSVLAGVDLEKVSENDILIDEEGKEMTIKLPRAEILQSPSIDMENVKTFSVEGIFRNEVDWEEGFAFAEVAKDLIQQEAIDQGLLQTAEKNAEKSLKEFFSQLGYNVTIEYKN